MDDKERAAIYVRVSTLDQSTDAQESELKKYAEQRGWMIYRVYSDRGQSGSKASRPALDDLLRDCQKGRIDIVLVWKFDRFARSLKQLIMALEDFGERGIEFVSCTEQIDTAKSSGKCFFQIIGAIAEFERDLIRDRVKAGLRHAVEKGQKLGRPPLHRISDKEAAQLKADHFKKAHSLRNLAKRYGVTLYQAHSICKSGEQRV